MVGKVSKRIGVSSIVFEICIGLILSPSMLGLMPPPYAECNARLMYVCTAEEAIKSIPRHHDHLAHMMNHLQEAKETLGWNMVIGEHTDHGGCKDEYKQYAELTVGLSAEQTAPWRLGADGVSRVGFTCAGLDTTASGACNALQDCIVKSCTKDIDHECQTEPNFFTLVGHLGVSMMIFESGMHFDFEKAKVVGAKACCVAVLGTFLPMVFGVIIVVYLIGEDFENGLAAGVSLAPTSVGIALKLLLEAKQLQKDFGQAIITAAFVDDILSLVAFNILFSVSAGSFTFVGAILPALIGMVFLVCGASLGITFWPYVIENVLSKVPAKRTQASLSRQDEALLLLMFVLLIVYGTFTFVLGTHLWGAFVAGMSFAMVHHAHHVWVRQVKRLTVWMLRVFFSCTVAFAIPWRALLSIEAFAWGSLMGVVACIATKVFCAFFMGEARFVIGWAMVGRAEFAYLIAEMAKSAGIMNEKVFAIVIWSLLYATIFAPFCFRKVLAVYAEKLADREAVSQKQLDQIRNLAENDVGIARKGSKEKVVQFDAQLSTSESKILRFESQGTLNGMAFRKTTNSANVIATTGIAHTTMDGHRWISSNLAAFRFQIVYNVHAQQGIGCNTEDLSEIWLLLRKMGLVVTNMLQKCDSDTHFCTFTVQADDGQRLEQSELSYVQEEIFQELRGLGAHVVFLPPMHALQDTCKLAKVTVIAHMKKQAAALAKGSSSISTIIDEIVKKDLFIMRAGLELHGESLIFEVLVGHEKSEEAHVEPISPINAKPRIVNRGGPRAPIQTANLDTYETPFDDGIVTKAQMGMEHLHLGTKNLPDITPGELNDMKVRVEKALETQICVVVDPLTYGHGPSGELSHDARTLMMALPEYPTAEIRFTMDSIKKDLFARALRVLCKPGIDLVSARVDERAACQINCVISSDTLTQQLEDRIMDELQAVAEGADCCGHIDLTNLDNPSEKIYREVGLTSQQNSPRLGPAKPPQEETDLQKISRLEKELNKARAGNGGLTVEANAQEELVVV